MITILCRPIGMLFVSLLLNAQPPRQLYPIITGDSPGDPPYFGKPGFVGFIDKKGKVVIPPRFPAVCGPRALPEFHEGLARMEGGYIDQAGRFAIPSQFGDPGDFHDGVASVAVPPTGPNYNAAAAWIDHAGKILFRRDYHLVTANPLAGPPSPRTEFSEGMLRLPEGDPSGLWGFVDRTFQWVIPPKYPRVDDFHDGLAYVWIGGSREAFIDKAGTEVISLAGRHAGSSFSGGLASATSPTGTGWGLLDRTGRDVIPPRFQFTMTLAGGYAAVGTDRGQALFDSQGKQLTPFKFDFKDVFAEGGFDGGLVPAAGALPGGQAGWGYINASGMWIIPPQFADALSFSGDLARVTLKTGAFGYVNRRGKIVWSGGHVTPCWAM